jgi:putative addiction module component (TIGR02574 family)
MDYQSVLNEVETWPIDDRIRLVQDVWDRLVDQGDEPELTEEMKAELDRRIEELDHNPAAGLPWNEVKARVLGRLRQ